MMVGEALWPWPEPPGRITEQLELMAREEDGGGEGSEAAALVDPDTGTAFTGPVPRPWDLAELDDPLQGIVLAWLDDVVLWHNHTYGWQEDQVIPGCWQDHPGLALDLAALAFGRIDSYDTATAAYVGRWHADWEDFQRRMSAALGDAGRDCRRGDHKRPARYAVDGVRDAVSRRRKASAQEQVPNQAPK